MVRPSREYVLRRISPTFSITRFEATLRASAMAATAGNSSATKPCRNSAAAASVRPSGRVRPLRRQPQPGAGLQLDPERLGQEGIHLVLGHGAALLDLPARHREQPAAKDVAKLRGRQL